MQNSHSSLPILLCLAMLAGHAHSREYWKVEPGASAMKMLSMPTEPRQAAIAGAGIASPAGAGEAFRNPLAGAASSIPALSFSRTEFSDIIGASRMSALAHAMFGSWHLTAGIETLNYGKLEERDDDGLAADNGYFSAGTTAAQLGLAKNFNSMNAGITARYANQNIYDYYAHGILFDGGLSYGLAGNSLVNRLVFGAVFSNLGWVFSDAETAEIAPLAFQTGVTANCPLPLNFAAAVSADLHRRTDSEREFRAGLELLYKEILSLRLGYPFSGNENNALSAGFAVNLGFASVEYAYQNRAAIEANHIFGVSLYF